MLTDENSDIGYSLSVSKYSLEIRKEVVKLMKSFFKDKFYWAGGVIPKNKLLKEEYIKIVAEMNTLDAYAIAYYCLDKNIPEGVDTSHKDWQRLLCYGIECDCKSRKIPKWHASGMMLVCLALCYGIDFLPVLKKLHEIRATIQKEEEKEDLQTEDDDFNEDDFE